MNQHETLPAKPQTRRGVMIYQAPAPVRVRINEDDGEALMDAGDTLTISFDGALPEKMIMTFDWNVEPGTIAHRYKINEKLGGVCDVWFERNSTARSASG